MNLENIMEQILQNKENYPQLSYFLRRLSMKDQEKLMNMITNIQKDKLYKSPIHGIYHSEKVGLFAYLLGKYYELDETDLKILTDAAVYHDFRRESDFEDSLHGLASAICIEKILPLEAVYSSRVNLLLLQAIVDYHSQKDEKLKINFDNYELPEKEFNRYQKLAYLLKDADALDRKRFSDKCQAHLKPEFLRFSESRHLIKLSEEVNKIYNEVMECNPETEIFLESKKDDCFHSIGFDFFRIKSVFDHGILSFSEMKEQNLNFPKNFTGGNMNRWISVVPANMEEKKGTAYYTFIQNGISFLCTNQLLCSPLEHSQKSIAILKGLPFNKSDYADERYVLSKIDSSKIVAMFISNNWANKDVNELSYLYNSLYYESLEEKVTYFLNQMGIISFETVPNLIELLAKYKRCLTSFESLDLFEQDEGAYKISESLDAILKEINSSIQTLIHEYYACLFDKKISDKITVSEVLQYELSKCDVKVTMKEGTSSLTFFTEELQKEKLFSTHC